MKSVLDTNTVVSALLFPKGRLAWLRAAWKDGRVRPLASRDTVAELVRVLTYPKFDLSQDEIELFLGEYLPFAELVDTAAAPRQRLPTCPDPDDQMFLELAAAGAAEVLVTGDASLLEMAGEVRFTIETPAAFRSRLHR